MPARVRAWVEQTLGSPVVASVEQIGGFSPGCATRLTCADGTRAFVKAVGAELNPDTPTLFRREVAALTALGSHPLWAALLASYDDGDWVALLLEDVAGEHPHLDDDPTMTRLLEATDELGAAMRDRYVVPEGAPPDVSGFAAPMFRPGPTDFRSVMSTWVESLRHVPDLPPDLVPPWLAARVPDLTVEIEALSRVPPTSPTHADIRDDNLIQRPDGSIVFVDWGAFGIGPDWLDPLQARLERVDSAWFDATLADSPPLARVGDELVTSWLAALGAHLAWRAHTAVDTNLPTLAAFRRVESARLLGAAARRWGLDPGI